MLLTVAPGVLLAQTASPALPPASPSQAAPSPAAASQAAKSPPAPVISNRDRRRATKLYLDATKLFAKEKFEEALHGYLQAAALDPSNTDYPLAANVARGHAVTALIQSAAKSRNLGDAEAARTAIAHALELDPKNPQATEHLYELDADPDFAQTKPRYERGAVSIGEAAVIQPSPGTHSFHLRTDQRSVIQQVFKAYGIEATVDASVRASQLHFDLDNATLAQAAHALELVTNSFHVPLDAHRVLVARDNREERQQFLRMDVETVYLPGLGEKELTDVGNLAKNVFEISQATVEQTSGTITLRGPQVTLDAFNATMHDLIDGHNQVLLEVRMIQLARTREHNTGISLPQQMAVFNVASQAQSILNANQSLVQQIISSGLAAPGDTLAIIAILLASGQVSSSLLSGGFATIGGGAISTTGLSPGTTTVNFSVNSSQSRELDEVRLSLGDGETGTLKTGVRYPIQTSSFSSLSGSGVNIPGLTGAGSSGALSSLLSSVSAIPPVPQVEYQDLGLTLKATPKVMRGDDVALTLDLKIDALAGSSINGNPVLNNRAYSGVVTLKRDESVVVLSELNKQESRAVSGTPGLTEIPGLDNVTGKDVNSNTSNLLIVVTPRVIRGTQAAGHTPMMRVERAQPAR